MDRLCQFRLELDAGWQSIASTLLVAVGGLYVCSKLWNVARTFLSIFVLPGKSLRSFGPKGSWAIVTGASDGIGKEYSLQLARAGFNIVLVSRSIEKLEAVSKEITSSNPSAKTKILAMDFTENYNEDYVRLQALIKDLDISILINNVGLSHSIPVPFALTPEEEIEDIITINCLGTLRVTQLVVPGMMERKRGLILTMGSFAGFLPTPLLATYSGSKAFLQHWSTSLGSELAPYGIHVQLTQSYLVTSAMSKIRRTSLSIPSPKPFVRATLSKIGRGSGLSTYAYTSVPYWSHALMAWSITTIIGAFSKTAVGINGSMHESIRNRALRKMERERGKKVL